MSEVKVHEGGKDGTHHMECGRYISVEDCKRMVEDGWNEGFSDQWVEKRPSAWAKSNTCAALKRLEK